MLGKGMCRKTRPEKDGMFPVPASQGIDRVIYARKFFNLKGRIEQIELNPVIACELEQPYTR